MSREAFEVQPGSLYPALHLLIFATIQKMVLILWTKNSYSSPLVLAVVPMLFLLCGACACTIPALRAVSIDPMQAVGYE